MDVTRFRPRRGRINDSGRLFVEKGGPVGQKQVDKAVDELIRYKQGKANLEARIIEDEEWYRLRHWGVVRRKRVPENGAMPPEPSSAWLFNALMNKHADASDNYPEPNILPREASDVDSAKVLSDVVPVIIERNGFEDTYSENWWEKLKHGTAAYGVFWDKTAEDGLGDVVIRSIDMLNLFWEPGITDIQASRRLYIVELRDTELLEEEYPHLKGKLGGGAIDVAQYTYDDAVDTADKTLVVDCYYKLRRPDGRTIVHYMKFAGGELLYASENDPACVGGFYEDDRYPVELDVLFPEKGTPAGFGYVAICKDPQLYIDKLGQNILENSMMATKIRYFAANSTGVNEDEFLDWSKPIVHVEGGSLDETKLKQIVVSPLDSIYANVLQMKIDELKETSANRDVNSGGAGSGVTAAAAIAALQEAGNKTSRDMISASYRSYQRLIYMVIERMRQFYTEERTFRVAGQMPGEMEFISFSNAALKEQEMPEIYPGERLEPGYEPVLRRPIFDIKVRAEKRNPFSQMAMNETAKELFRIGAFSPERATEASVMLDMMEFEGIDQVREKVQQGQTLLSMMQQMSMQMEQMAALLQITTGRDMGVGAAGGTAGASSPASPGAGINAQAAQAQGTGRTAYMDALAKKSVPDMGAVNSGATPG